MLQQYAVSLSLHAAYSAHSPSAKSVSSIRVRFVKEGKIDFGIFIHVPPHASEEEVVRFVKGVTFLVGSGGDLDSDGGANGYDETPTGPKGK